tara:strand:+ start:34 stop:288 length:255 start_codon:yes stop_codon:yes gene_type:complete
LSNRSSLAGFGSNNNSLIISRRGSAKREASSRRLLKQSTFSEDPYRSKKIHDRFTSGNKAKENSDSDSETLSGSIDEDDIFEGI